MKKAMVILAVLALTFGSASAQTNKFDIGIEGGPSLVFLHGNEMLGESNHPTTGVSAGAFFQYNFKKILSLRTNLSFERKGSFTRYESTDYMGIPIEDVTINSRFDYLTLPLLVRATFGKKVQFFINTGPYIGFLIQLSTITKGGLCPTKKGNSTSLMKRFDAGLTTGIGLAVPFKQKFAFTFEARNNMGLVNISAVPVYKNGSILTNSTNFMFGFTYRLGKLSH
jgi:hypothetical protein